jgi:hypothetical protein
MCVWVCGAEYGVGGVGERREMFEEKQLVLDRGTFLALAKLISAQLIVSASLNSGQTFMYDEPLKSSVTIEEIPDETEGDA